MKSTTKVRAVTAVAAPVSVVSAAVGVVTNPWRVDRRNFGQFFHRSMRSKMWLTLATVVDKCENCHERHDHRQYRAGNKVFSSFASYSEDERNRTHAHDSHCSEHWKAVAAYHDHIRGAE